MLNTDTKLAENREKTQEKWKNTIGILSTRKEKKEKSLGESQKTRKNAPSQASPYR